MSEKTMLIAGCSHAAGSEIDGSTDSIYNREHSFGNILAKKLGRKPINVAVCGYTNSAIARSILEWFNSNKNIDDVFVLICWTESSRIEAPFEFPTWHNSVNGKYCDWFSDSSTDFLQINPGHIERSKPRTNFITNKTNYTEREKDIQADYQNFVIKRTEFTEIYSANLVLQIQFYLKYKNCKYLMCDTGYMFTHENEKYLNFYNIIIDKKNYYNFSDTQQSFYTKFKNLGYINDKAKYGHHGEEPHRLYAEELYNFIQEQS